MNVKAPKAGPRFAIPSYVVSVRGEHGSMVTNDRALVASQVECYLSSRPGGVVDVEYFEQCGHCRGSGRKLVSRRTSKSKPCPACKGTPELVTQMRVQTFVGPAWSPAA
jgi:hypothetical protein